LPAREDEGQEATPIPWLSSLGVDNAAMSSNVDETTTPKGQEEVGWLTSLGIPGKSGTGAITSTTRESARDDTLATTSWIIPQVSPAVQAWAGKALPIAPFWRCANDEELWQAKKHDRKEHLSRMMRMAKDAAKRKQKSSGRLRQQPLQI